MNFKALTVRDLTPASFDEKHALRRIRENAEAIDRLKGGIVEKAIAIGDATQRQLRRRAHLHAWLDKLRVRHSLNQLLAGLSPNELADYHRVKDDAASSVRAAILMGMHKWPGTAYADFYSYGPPVEPHDHNGTRFRVCISARRGR
jgi:hypothetical protein